DPRAREGDRGVARRHRGGRARRDRHQHRQRRQGDHRLHARTRSLRDDAVNATPHDPEDLMTARIPAACAALVAATVIATLPVARAEVSEIRIAQQYGINYLTLMVMEDRKLVEAQARRVGLGEVKVSWPKMSSGAAMNDALLSGNLEV